MGIPKQVVLIDTENIIPTYQELISLTGSIELVFFLSTNSKNIHPLCMAYIAEKKLEITYKIIDSSYAQRKNLLDICLSMYLVKNIKANHKYYVLSKDSDFKGASDFAKNEWGLEIHCIGSLEEVSTEQQLRQEKIDHIKSLVYLAQQEASKKGSAQLYQLLLKNLRGLISMEEISTIYQGLKSSVDVDLIVGGPSRPLEHNSQEVVKSTQLKEPKKKVVPASPKPKLSKSQRVSKVKKLKQQTKTLAEFKASLHKALSEYTLDLDIDTIYKNNLSSFKQLHGIK